MPICACGLQYSAAFVKKLLAMFKRLLTALKTRLAPRTQKTTPRLKEAQETLEQAMITLDRATKQQQAWQIKLKTWQAEIDKKRIKNNKFLKRVGRASGGIANKIGKAAEQFFVSAVENAMPFMIQDIAFHQIFVNKHFMSDQQEMECDIVLVNKQYIVILEIKHFLEPYHVVTFNKKLQEVLPQVLPNQYKHLHLMPAMACMALNQDAEEQARACGFALLRPHGQQSRVEDAYLRVRLPMGH